MTDSPRYKYVGPGNPTHGTASTYRSSIYKCRCYECTEANTERQYADNAARAERLRKDPTLAPHGKRSTYCNWGCRCDPCTEANSAECAEYQASLR